MAEILYSEIIPFPGSGGKWKEILFNAGATQSTLQEIKLPDGAGFYSYQDSNSLGGPVSNRFIYWRVTHDILELVELSLDATLISNQLKLRFQQSPVLDGISVHELENHVVILISTVASVHRLVFTHPNKLKEFASVSSSEILLPSIFYDVALANIRNPATYHVLNNVAEGNALPHVSCSWLTPEQEAVFVLANNMGFLQVIIMDPHSNKICNFELRQASIMSRLSYLVPVIRNNSSENITMGLVHHVFQEDSLIIALGKDLKIKLWSFESRECLKSESVLELAGHDPNINLSEVTDSKICKALDSNQNSLILCVYINHYENLFCIVQVVKHKDIYSLHHLTTITGPELDLVDFKLSFNQLWTLWLNGDSQAVVKFMNLNSHQDKAWRNTSLLPSIVKAYHPKHLDTREVYLKEIFYPGRFSTTIISKAIVSYRREIELYIPPDITLAALKDEVITAIEGQIHAQACQSELSLEDYMALQVDCWETFFSYCIQYHEVGTRVLGLCIDVGTGFTGVIKENFISFLRPCDDMESIVLSNSSVDKPLNFKDNKIVTQNPNILKPLQKVLDCLNIVHSAITYEMSYMFHTKLHFLKAPSKLALKLVSELSNGAESIENELETSLSMLQNFTDTCKVLIDSLDLGQIEAHLYDVQEANCPPNLLFTSATGFSSVCEGVQQFAQNRYLFCRNLLILQHFVLKLGEKCGQQIDSDLNELIKKTSSLCANYYVLSWSTQCKTVPVSSNTGDIATRHMSLLSLKESVAVERPSASLSILEVFLREQGGKLAQSILFQEDRKQEYIWSDILPSLVIILSKLLWPSNHSLYFPQFLLSQSQYLPLQQYLRLLTICTSENSCSRSFLHANCLLFMNESHHAIELLIQASKGIFQESFLYSKLLHSTVEADSTELQALYFFKVIQLLEHFSLPDCVIQIASHHLNSLSNTDPNFPAFHTVLFGNYLELGHLDEAFNSLLNNTGDSKKNCLRKLVSVLCDRKQFDKLVQFKYIELEKEFISIILGRARGSDLSHNFYELLYSYYINNHNYRGAGTTMYEQALRLGRETYGDSAALAKQVKCYLSTLNCLKLGDPNYHWIVKPDLRATCGSESPNMSPKRNSDGEEIVPTKAKHEIEIMDVSDIQKQFHLARARLSLFYIDSSPTNLALSPMAPQEVVTLLVTNGLFEEAINLSLSFDLSLVPIFEGFILKSMNQQERIDRWSWLQRNDTSSLPVMTKEDDLAWLLLKQYLEAHEKPSLSEYHKAIVVKLFSFNFSELPLWLLHSYQRRNAPELLWLYIQYGYLEKATILAISYMDAVLGKGKNYFNLKTCLKSSNPAVWLPYSLLNTLIESLTHDDRHNDSINKELYDKLERKLQEYFVELECETKRSLTITS